MMRNSLTISSMLLFICLFASGRSVAQNLGSKFVEFESENHNFGDLYEANGNGEHKFMFTNVSDKPIKLTYVKAACGCTATDYTQEEVKPGQKGYVNAVYSTANRPGRFTKSVTVRITTTDNLTPEGREDDMNLTQTTVLVFEGNVIPKEKGPEDYYPFVDGGLRFSTNHVTFGNITNKEVKTQTFVVYNAAEEAITLTGFEIPVHYAKVKILEGKKTLAPKDSAIVEVTYDGAGVGDYGFVHTIFFMETNDPNTPKKRIYLSGTIYEDFSHLTEAEKAKAPVARFDKTDHDFGDAGNGQILETEFMLTNDGQMPLEIRKLKSSCSCTVSQPAKTTIKPGETVPIKVTYDTRGKQGRSTQVITAILNDPANSSHRLLVRANVLQPSEK